MPYDYIDRQRDQMERWIEQLYGSLRVSRQELGLSHRRDAELQRAREEVRDYCEREGRLIDDIVEYRGFSREELGLDQQTDNQTSSDGGSSTSVDNAVPLTAPMDVEPDNAGDVRTTGGVVSVGTLPVSVDVSDTLIDHSPASPDTGTNRYGAAVESTPGIVLCTHDFTGDPPWLNYAGRYNADGDTVYMPVGNSIIGEGSEVTTITADQSANEEVRERLEHENPNDLKLSDDPAEQYLLTMMSFIDKIVPPDCPLDPPNYFSTTYTDFHRQVKDHVERQLNNVQRRLRPYTLPRRQRR